MNTISNGTAANGVTVLTAKSKKTGKTFFINDKGELDDISYGNEWLYTYRVRPISAIHQLAELVTQLSTTQNTIIIRGQPKTGIHGLVRRTLDNYAEPPEGLSWAMLDFDAIPLPDGLSPTSREAIEWLIEKLPDPFHDAAYFYQFSSSTGIFHPAGRPRKRGLNVHLFFWFSRPITGQMLKAYLTDHCIKTDFLERGRDKADSPRITYGVDMSLFNPVQPHYIAAPIIKEGVTRTLDEKDRQGLVEKAVLAVVLPELHKDLPALADAARQRVLIEWKKACGLVRDRSITKAFGGGIAVHHYYRNPNPAAVTTGRRMAKEPKLTEKLDQNGQPITYARFYFDDEGTPGSWYVSSRSPAMARRFGDGAEESLKELSEAAYCYVRDELHWFSDIETKTLPLTPEGYLPALNTFAKAKNSVILAPTGTGKTTAFCAFAMNHRTDIIIYAAQTISLTQQMKHDLRRNNVRVTHYWEDFNKFEVAYPGVYVTTNESMAKIVEWVRSYGRGFFLVIDEVHMAIDDFMKTNSKNRLLENTISRAKQSFFMSGTITPLQLKKLTETISVATGEMTPENYGYYEFAPVKSNPLWWADYKQFGGDFVALLRHYQALKENGEAIPRTVIMVPTGKMRRYEILLDAHGLLGDADVVSSPEATQDEIEAARVSHKAILISSPVFALGQNFECVPVRLWAFYDENLQVDTSQIIQTLNRANRTAAACEVRLYVAFLNPIPIRLPDQLAEQMKIGEYFIGESDFKGLLDSHFQVERVTYRELREFEHDTAKSLYQLKTDDSIQNFHIVENWVNPFPATKEDQQAYREAKNAANRSYRDDVLRKVVRYQEEPTALLLQYLNDLKPTKRKRPDASTLKKVVNDRKKAIAMVLAQAEMVGIGGKIKPMRIVRMYGEAPVFLSGQFDWMTMPEWTKTASEKTAALATLLSLLKELKSGVLNGVSFAKKMRHRGKKAVLALVDNETDFIAWSDELKVMDKLHDMQQKSASKVGKTVIDGEFFKVAQKFLETIGVYFTKTRWPDGSDRFDPDKPVVPDWDFDEMARVLLVKAESLKHFPVEPLDVRIEAHKWPGTMSLAVCQKCVHCDPFQFCRLLRQVECELLDYAADTEECNAFVPVPERLMPNK
jgi:hypothetical protein